MQSRNRMMPDLWATRQAQIVRKWKVRPGISVYLKNSGNFEVAEHIENHESPRTTKLQDRRQDEISLDEIERTI
jgi:hypothetical protein